MREPTRLVLAAGVVLLAVAAFVVVTDQVPAPVAAVVSPMDRASDEADTVHEVEVAVAPDREGMQSFLAYAPITQPARTNGPARDRIDLTFDEPVDVHGVLASVDLSHPELFELEVVRNSEVYGSGRGRMVHFTAAGTYVIDDQAWFPVPYRFNADDTLSVVAWMANLRSETMTGQPEVIVYFTPVRGTG